MTAGRLFQNGLPVCLYRVKRAGPEYKVIDLKQTDDMPQVQFEAYINFLIQSRDTIKQQAAY
jgi:hypothetical protein